MTPSVPRTRLLDPLGVQVDLPLTGTRCVNLIITDLAVMEVRDRGLALIELAPDVTLETVASRTAARYTVDLASG